MPVRFLVTGFGHFAGVQCNPTQQLVEWLKTEHQHRLPQFPGCKAFSSSSTADETLRSASSAHTRTHVPVGSAHDDFQVLSCTVLEVSAEAVAIFLQEQQRILSGACSSCDGQPIILLHLGVDTQVITLWVRRHTQLAAARVIDPLFLSTVCTAKLHRHRWQLIPFCDRVM